MSNIYTVEISAYFIHTTRNQKIINKYKTESIVKLFNDNVPVDWPEQKDEIVIELEIIRVVD